MKDEELIKKWLKGELTDEELIKIQELDSYASYSKISEYAKCFKAPHFDEANSLKKLDLHKQNKTKKLRWAVGIVATIAVCFFIFEILNPNHALNTFETDIAKTKTFDLPDNSEVNLNSKSVVTFNSNNWNKKRSVHLEGEALFKVEKGKTFTVETDYGEVEVLGTQFNVKSRDYEFEVSCYHGSVSVNLNTQNYVLQKNEMLIFRDKKIKTTVIKSNTPDWKSQSTVLKSKPLEVVLKEFKNYYDVKFDASNVDVSRLYTGSFNHNNLEIALKSVTLPLEMTYQIQNKKVILSDK